MIIVLFMAYYIFGLTLMISIFKIYFGDITYYEFFFMVMMATVWPIVLMLVILDEYGDKNFF